MLNSFTTQQEFFINSSKTTSVVLFFLYSLKPKIDQQYVGEKKRQKRFLSEQSVLLIVFLN